MFRTSQFIESRFMDARAERKGGREKGQRKREEGTFVVLSLITSS